MNITLVGNIVWWTVEILCIAALFAFASYLGIPDPPKWSAAWFFWCFLVGYVGCGIGSDLMRLFLGIKVTFE